MPDTGFICMRPGRSDAPILDTGSEASITKNKKCWESICWQSAGPELGMSSFRGKQWYHCSGSSICYSPQGWNKLQCTVLSCRSWFHSVVLDTAQLPSFLTIFQVWDDQHPNSCSDKIILQLRNLIYFHFYNFLQLFYKKVIYSVFKNWINNNFFVEKSWFIRVVRL